MAIDGVSGRTSFLGSNILNIRSQLDTLTQQLATGKVATTYAGQGFNRGLAVAFRSQLNSIDSFKNTATTVTTRVQVANLSLQRLASIQTNVKAAAVSATTNLDNNGQTPAQKTANLQLVDLVELLNVRAGDRYLFSGRSTDTQPVASVDALLNGIGAQAGLKQVINERRQADIGSGNGRLTITAPTTTSVSVAEETPATVFGLKLSAVNSTLTGSTVTGPTGAPPAVSVDLGATNPNNNEKVKFTFALPDGTFENIELTATTTTPLPLNSFAIGVDSIATTANLNAALTTAVGKLANGALVAASAVKAGDEFFNATPPVRVDGPPFASATAQIAGTSANTVTWYAGETGTDPARGTAIGRVDQSITVQYGARANEQAFRSELQSVAVFAAVTSGVTDPNASAQLNALNQRIAQNLADQPGTQSIEDVQADFAGALASIQSVSQRQTQSKAIAQSFLDEIEGISKEEVATKVLALQTSLQASYQTTASLFQLSLVKFL